MRFFSIHRLWRFTVAFVLLLSVLFLSVDTTAKSVNYRPKPVAKAKASVKNSVKIRRKANNIKNRRYRKYNSKSVASRKGQSANKNRRYRSYSPVTQGKKSLRPTRINEKRTNPRRTSSKLNKLRQAKGKKGAPNTKDTLKKMALGYSGIETAKAATGGVAYKIGRISSKNAFILSHNGKHELYVHANYKGYRNLAKRLDPSMSKKMHADHSASRAIEKKLGKGGYIRLARVPDKVNIAHGTKKEKTVEAIRHFRHAAQAPVKGTKEGKVSHATKDALDKLLQKMPKGKGHQALTNEAYNKLTLKDMRQLKKSLFEDKLSQQRLAKMRGKII